MMLVGDVIGMKKRISQSMSGPMILSAILSGWTFAQNGDSHPTTRPAAIIPDRKERFIAAVDWSVDKTPEFVWPFEPMPPAPYDSVRLVVESMPWSVTGERKGNTSEPLVASRHLNINGRLQKPVRVIRSTNNQPEQQEFLVKLEGGRLRLKVTLPAGTKLDHRHAMVRLKLYEV